MSKLAYLPVGRVINTHGFRGTVKLESWCDSPEILAELERVYIYENGTYCARSVRRASVFKQFVLMDIEEIESEAAADLLRGKEIFAARAELPLKEGSFFISDLLGLPVRDADSGAVLGELKDVNTSGAQDLYVVKTLTGEALIPAVPQFIIRIDPDDAIYVRPIAGLLDGGAENV